MRGPSWTRVTLSHNCGSEVVCIDLGQHYHGSRRKKNVGVFDFISESNWQQTNGLSVLVAELFYTDKRKFGSRHSIAACCRLFNTKILIVEISLQYFRSKSYVFLGLQSAYPVDQVII